MTKKAVIFDMDGVLIDSESIHVAVDQAIFSELGIRVSDEEMSQFIGVATTDMWPILKERYKIETSVSTLVKMSEVRKVEAFKKMTEKPIEGIPALLKELGSKGYHLAVASSSPMVHIDLILRTIGIKDCFQAFASGEEVKRGKPAPDVYLEAALLVGVEPGACYVIEDSERGVHAAKAAGMICIAYDNVKSINQDYSEADYVVSAIEDITAQALIP